MKIGDSLPFVGYIERALPQRILRCDSSGTPTGMACLRLNTAQRKHKASRRIAPIGAKRHDPRDIKGGYNLTACTNLYSTAQVQSYQGIVHK